MRPSLVCSTALSLVAAMVAQPSGAATNPDFSGFWGRNAFNFEPLSSGPKPLRNLERLPDGTANRTLMVGDYTNPILRPEAAKTIEQRGNNARSGDPHPDPSNQCQSWPPPFAFSMQLGFEMLKAEDHITILYNQDDQVRRVRLNSVHPKDLAPTPMGDSIGHYEGDTLVIDTVDMATGPQHLPIIDRYGTPRSAAMHVVERYRLIDGATAADTQKKNGAVYRPSPPYGRGTIDPDTGKKGLEVEFRVEDPAVFTTPWSGRVTYRRLIGDWPEAVCAENPHYFGAGVAAPTAMKPDF